MRGRPVNRCPISPAIQPIASAAGHAVSAAIVAKSSIARRVPSVAPYCPLRTVTATIAQFETQYWKPCAQQFAVQSGECTSAWAVSRPNAGETNASTGDRCAVGTTDATVPGLQARLAFTIRPNPTTHSHGRDGVAVANERVARRTTALATRSGWSERARLSRPEHHVQHRQANLPFTHNNRIGSKVG